MAKQPRYDGLTADLPPAAAAALIAGTLLEAVLASAPDVLRGDDTRAVHDMRVSIRRMRSALTTFEDCFPPKVAPRLQNAIRRLGRKLGDVRDADVHLAALRGALSGATAADRPGVAFVIDALLERRRHTLADFAIELSQFDRDAFVRMLARA